MTCNKCYNNHIGIFCYLNTSTFDIADILPPSIVTRLTLMQEALDVANGGLTLVRLHSRDIGDYKYWAGKANEQVNNLLAEAVSRHNGMSLVGLTEL